MEEALNKLTVEQVEDRYEVLCKRLELIRAVAEHVEKLFHEIKLFHSDIKPENLFKIDLLTMDIYMSTDWVISYTDIDVEEIAEKNK